MIYTVTFNPSLDYIVTVPHFTCGMVNRTSEEKIFPGGKGLNQSVALGRAGAYVFHGGFSGNGSEFLIETMESSGVNTGRICKQPESPGHAIIQVDKTGQNCIMLYPGTNHMFTADYIETFLGDAQPGDILLLQNECDCLEDAFIIAHGKKLQIAFNPSPFHEKIRDLPLEYISWWFCNEIEGAALFGSTEPDFIADNFARMYPESNLILTLGEEGSMYQSQKCRNRNPKPKTVPYFHKLAICLNLAFICRRRVYFHTTQFSENVIKDIQNCRCKRRKESTI